MNSDRKRTANDELIENFYELLGKYLKQYDVCMTKVQAIRNPSLLNQWFSSSAPSHAKPSSSTPLLPMGKNHNVHYDHRPLVERVNEMFTTNRENTLKRVAEIGDNVRKVYDVEMKAREQANHAIGELTKRKRAVFEAGVRSLQALIRQHKPTVERNIKHFIELYESREELKKYADDLERRRQSVARGSETYSADFKAFDERNKSRKNLVGLMKHVPRTKTVNSNITFHQIEDTISSMYGKNWKNTWNKSDNFKTLTALEPAIEAAFDTLNTRSEQVAYAKTVIDTADWENKKNRLNTIQKKLNDQKTIELLNHFLEMVAKFVEEKGEENEDKRKVQLQGIEEHFDVIIQKLSLQMNEDEKLKHEIEDIERQVPERVNITRVEIVKIAEIKDMQRRYLNLLTFLEKGLADIVRHQSEKEGEELLNYFLNETFPGLTIKKNERSIDELLKQGLAYIAEMQKRYQDVLNDEKRIKEEAVALVEKHLQISRDLQVSDHARLMEQRLFLKPETSETGEVIRISRVNMTKADISALQNEVTTKEDELQRSWRQSLMMNEEKNCYSLADSITRRKELASAIESLGHCFKFMILYEPSIYGEKDYQELALSYKALISIIEQIKQMIEKLNFDVSANDFNSSYQSNIDLAHQNLTEMLNSSRGAIATELAKAKTWCLQLELDDVDKFIELFNTIMSTGTSLHHVGRDYRQITDQLESYALTRVVPFAIVGDTLLKGQSDGASLNDIDKWFEGNVAEFECRYREFQSICQQRESCVNQAREWAGRLRAQPNFIMLDRIGHWLVVEKEVELHQRSHNVKENLLKYPLSIVLNVYNQQFRAKWMKPLIVELKAKTLTHLKDYDRAVHAQSDFIHDLLNDYFSTRSELARKLKQAEYEIMDWSIFESFYLLDVSRRGFADLCDVFYKQMASYEVFPLVSDKNHDVLTTLSTAGMMSLSGTLSSEPHTDLLSSLNLKGLANALRFTTKSFWVSYQYPVRNDIQKITSRVKQGFNDTLTPSIILFSGNVKKYEKDCQQYHDTYKTVISDLAAIAVVSANASDRLNDIDKRKKIENKNKMPVITAIAEHDPITILKVQGYEAGRHVLNETGSVIDANLVSIGVAKKQLENNELDLAVLNEEHEQLKRYQGAIDEKKEYVKIKSALCEDKESLLSRINYAFDNLIGVIKSAHETWHIMLREYDQLTYKNQFIAELTTALPAIHAELKAFNVKMAAVGVESFPEALRGECRSLLGACQRFEDQLKAFYDHPNFVNEIDKKLDRICTTILISEDIRELTEEDRLWTSYHNAMSKLYDVADPLLSMHAKLLASPDIVIPERNVVLDDRIKQNDDAIQLILAQQNSLKAIIDQETIWNEKKKVFEEQRKAFGLYATSHFEAALKLAHDMQAKRTKVNATAAKLENEKNEVRKANESFISEPNKVTGIVFTRFKIAFFNDAEVKKLLTGLEERAKANTNNTEGEKRNTTPAIQKLFDDLNKCDSDLKTFSGFTSKPLSKNELLTEKNEIAKLTKRGKDQVKTQTGELITKLNHEMERLIQAHDAIVYLDDVKADFEEREALINRDADVDAALCDESHFNYHYRTLKDKIGNTKTTSRADLKRDLLKCIEDINQSNRNGKQKIIELKVAVRDALQQVENSGGKPGLFVKGSELYLALNGYLAILDKVMLDVELTF